MAKQKRLTGAQLAAQMLALNCVRNSPLEDLHAGIYPSSKTGDFSDVKVVTPFGEIPWSEVSRISDEEMKSLMISVVNALFTVLSDDPSKPKVILRYPPEEWNTPVVDKDFLISGELLKHQDELREKGMVGVFHDLLELANVKL
jgi:hypothetical protein